MVFFSILSPLEPPSVSHAIPTSLESIENLAQEIYDEHLAQISQENKQPSNGFKFVHSHTPKEELLSPHSGQPLKSYSYQYIGKDIVLFIPLLNNEITGFGGLF